MHLGAYERVAVETIDDRGQRLSGFTYQSSLTRDDRKPSPRYLGLILEGAREHGLAESYIRWLQGLSLAIDEREAP